MTVTFEVFALAMNWEADSGMEGPLVAIQLDREDGGTAWLIQSERIHEACFPPINHWVQFQLLFYDLRFKYKSRRTLFLNMGRVVLLLFASWPILIKSSTKSYQFSIAKGRKEKCEQPHRGIIVIFTVLK